MNSEKNGRSSFIITAADPIPVEISAAFRESLTFAIKELKTSRQRELWLRCGLSEKVGKYILQ